MGLKGVRQAKPVKDRDAADKKLLALSKEVGDKLSRIFSPLYINAGAKQHNRLEEVERRLHLLVHEAVRAGRKA